MQEVTPWPDSFDVAEPVARVLVDGQEVPVESVSVSSELGSAMPERVVAGGGMAASTGDASVLRSQDVSEDGLNPWGDAGRFAAAREVVVEAGYRDPATGVIGCARQMTGQVDALDGGALSNAMGLQLVDHTPALDREITIEPLMRLYPPIENNGHRLGAGLSPFYVTNRVLRHCGFYSTPPLLNQAVVSAPLFGSGVAERGTLFAGVAASGAPYSAVFQAVPWGLGLSDGQLQYAPDFGSRGHGRLTSTLHVSFLRSAFSGSSPSTSSINLQWGSWNNAVMVYADSFGTVTVRYRTNGTTSTVASLPAGDVAESETFTVLIRPSGEATIYASNGQSASGMLPLPPLATSQDMTEVMVQVPETGNRLGGVQVAFSTTRNEGFVRTAHIESPIYWGTLAFPFQHEVNCLDLLKDHAKAELAAIWIDEAGHFRWRNRQQLRSATPKGTLTSEHDLLSLPWEFPVRSVYSRVNIDRDEPSITRRTRASITVSDRSGGVLGTGEDEQLFIEAPGDEDWHMVEAPQWLGGTVGYYQLVRGRGSYSGGIVVDDDDNERLAYSSRLVQSWQQIHPQRWLLSSAAINLGGSEYIEQAFRDRPDLYGRFAGESLPIIRAKGVVRWEKETLTASQQGPEWAPEYTHQVGPWVQAGQALGFLAEDLGEALTKPEPVLRDITIVPDPRIQLGDVFWLEDRSAFHVRLRVVVMGKTLTYHATSGGPEMTQRITCRVIAVQRLKVTYDELEAEWQGRNYTAFESAWSDQDYNALEANPLERN